CGQGAHWPPYSF
nr:immunoglobulin light chain junction region [Macaca mulatta]MOX08113.1 immunoglobulin light chain junction region [Macaca mulatta]MOX09122.1 immunoglobulin light chain junction region [Macaca mulatta]MOX09441.1 immunoglobulin light chain junction region [Macaca mulatta]MOX10518.1 immunoglobulin light chain junction region [Macaca mulatta]